MVLMSPFGRNLVEEADREIKAPRRKKYDDKIKTIFSGNDAAQFAYEYIRYRYTLREKMKRLMYDEVGMHDRLFRYLETHYDTFEFREALATAGYDLLDIDLRPIRLILFPNGQDRGESYD